jgi:hypothetical protein
MGMNIGDYIAIIMDMVRGVYIAIVICIAR